MTKLIVELSISLDGFVAGPNDGPDNPLGDGGQRLFDWYQSGDTGLALPGTDMTFRVHRTSAEFLREHWSTYGSGIAGRRTFDIAKAWGGQPPVDGPMFIVTHQPPQEWMDSGSPYTFITDGVESAVRQAVAAANGRNVTISTASVAQQCLNAGLLDEIHLDLAPVLLGGGVRLFDHLKVAPVELEQIRVVETPDVTHLHYRVLK
jgi:dihydrofolate reductase